MNTLIFSQKLRTKAFKTESICVQNRTGRRGGSAKIVCTFWGLKGYFFLQKNLAFYRSRAGERCVQHLRNPFHIDVPLFLLFDRCTRMIFLNALSHNLDDYIYRQSLKSNCNVVQSLLFLPAPLRGTFLRTDQKS